MKRVPQKASPSSALHNGETRRSQIVLYAVLSVVCFIGALILIAILLWHADLLVRLGLIGNFYYFTLILFGLMAAGFLFGALRSFARYSGRHLGGSLQLGGPLVVFLLVIILGVYLPSPPMNFPLTVYVHGELGPQDLVLKDHGSILLDLGGDRRQAKIQDKGQAVFTEIPANFRGQWVNVLLDAEGYDLAETNPRRLEDTSLYLRVRRKSARLTGRVQDEAGYPIGGVLVTVAGYTIKTDSTGRFDLTIPGDRLQAQLPLQAIAKGYAASHEWAVPGGGDLVVVLTPLQE